MKHTFKKFFTLGLLFSISTLTIAEHRDVTPKLTIRSQGTNAARRAMNSTNHTMLYDMDKWYGTFSISPEYTRSFEPKDITECLFGDFLCDKKILKIQGSRVTNRSEKALLADYFYLPTDFSSEVRIEPVISNFLVDMNFFLGLDEWVQGLYMFAQFPITYTKWDLNCCETVKETGTLAHLAGYFSPDAMDRDLLLDGFTEFTLGKAPAALSQTVSGTQFTVKFRPLNCARICCGNAETDTRVSELRFALGYNFLLDEDYHLGVNFQVVAPTGNRVKPTLLFAPQNGNGGHWELGGAINAGFNLWRSEDESKNISFLLDVNLTHMFKTCEKRCFDLCGKPLSRYMLAEKMISSDNFPNGLQISQDNALNIHPSHQFDNEFAPIANITTLNVDVSVGIVADIVGMFNYTSNNWSYDIGYNFYARSCEKIRTNCDCNGFEANTWAIKGDAHVYGFEENSGAARPLSATMSKANINGGTNFGTDGVTAGSVIEGNNVFNLKVDNVFGARTPTGGQLRSNPNVDGLIGSSFNPILISQQDINFARTKSRTHKIFSHTSYNWFDLDKDYVPYIGIGFETEFSVNDSDCKDCSSCTSDCDEECDISKVNGNCMKCGISQWGVLIKGGIDF